MTNSPTATRRKPHDQDPSRQEQQPPRKRRGGRLAFAVTALIALVVLAPTIVSRTPLRGTCLAVAGRLAYVNGSVAAGGLSLGWLSPVSATAVEIRDADGNSLVSLASIQFDKTLLNLVLDRAHLGRIKLDGVKAEVTCTDTGSNLEEVFSAWLRQPQTTRVACEVELSDAQAVIHDTAAKRDWRCDQLALHLTLPENEGPLEIDLAASVEGDGQTGRLTLKYPPAAGLGSVKQERDGTAPAGPAADEVVLQADSLPVALLQPLLRRVVPGCELAGRLAAQLGWQRDANGAFQIDGSLTVASWEWTAPGCEPWTEEQLGLSVSAAGTLAGTTLERLETAVVEATSQAGRLDARLVEPLDHPTAGTTWPVTLGAEGDLGTWLARFMPSTSAAGGWRLAGHCQAAANVQYSEQATGGAPSRTISGEVELTVRDLVVTPPHGPPAEPQQVKLTVNGGYEFGADTVGFTKFELDSAVVAASGRGEIGQLHGKPSVRVEGQVEYDLQQAQEWLRPYAGDSLQLAGRESQPFSFAGPLLSAGEDPLVWLARCEAKADVAWQTASFHGFSMGQGRIEAQLADGLVRAAPFDLPVSEGRVHLAPQLRVSPAPAVLTHDAGRIVESVVLTPEMCNAGMKYAVPVLAGVTQADGRFSVDLAGCTLPLADVGAGDAAGKLTIHSVELGPGILVRAFAPLLETLHQVFAPGNRDPLAAVSIARECPVDFRLVNRRVYHRGLVLEFPNVTVQTFGSVGLDESLAIMAELTLPEPWTAGHPLGAALATKPLRVPIGGTLKRPHIDGREIERLAGRAVEETAQGVIHHELGQELKRGLDHLFGPQ